jgi:cell wall-associated NlpC family hydrolase
MRFALALVTVGACAGCASSLTSGTYSPRPFPKADAPAATAPARVRTAPAPSTAPAPAPSTVSVSGPAVSTDRIAVSSALITTALALRGIPYRLGGADLNGFDCSGLVQYVMRQHGIDMPRTVIEQFDIGATTNAIETGDLVFFQTIGSKASHVGIAIDAETFVHAPNSRGVVRVERLDAPYWSSRFLGARRVF